MQRVYDRSEPKRLKGYQGKEIEGNMWAERLLYVLICCWAMLCTRSRGMLHLNSNF